MAEIKSGHDLEKWLNNRPEATRRVEAVAIAGRAALRVLPLHHYALYRSIGAGEHQLFHRFIMMSFRVLATARLYAIAPSRVGSSATEAYTAATDVCAEVNAISEVLARRDGLAAFNEAARSDLDASRIGSRTSAESFRKSKIGLAAADSARAAVGAAADTRAAGRAAAYAASAVTYDLDSEIWKPISHDTVVLSSWDGGVTELLKCALWIQETSSGRGALETSRVRFSGALNGDWFRLKAFLIDAGDDWDVWMQWYEGVSVGGPVWGLPLDRADAIMAEALQWDESEWKQGPGHINRRIRELIEKAGASRDPPGNAPPYIPPEPVQPQDQRTDNGLRDFFVSYATPDEPMAREICAVLEEAGHSTVAQFKDFQPGSNFVNEMQRGLADSGRMVAIYSPRYAVSDHCQAEWSAAYNADASGARRKIVPFMIEPTELPPLARQVVFKTLIGLSKAQRKKAILEAIAPPVRRSSAQIQAALAKVASPKAAVRDGKIGVEPNPAVDAPLTKGDIDGLPQSQVELAKVILECLPRNAPESVRAGLSGYARHLTEFGPRPRMRHLNTLCGGVEGEYKAMGLEEWGKGLETYFTDFFRDHTHLRTHYPRAEEQIYEDVQVDESAAHGDNLTRPIKAVVEATKAASDAGQVLPDMVEAVVQTAETGKSIEHLDADPVASQPGSTRMSLKRRYVLGALAFIVSFYNLLGSTASIVSTPTGAALYKALGEAIEKFTTFIR